MQFMYFNRKPKVNDYYSQLFTLRKDNSLNSEVIGFFVTRSRVINVLSDYARCQYLFVSPVISASAVAKFTDMTFTPSSVSGTATEGFSVAGTTTILDENNETTTPTTTLKLPIEGGTGISVGANAAGKAIKVELNPATTIPDGSEIAMKLSETGTLRVSAPSDTNFVRFNGYTMDLDGSGDTWLTIGGMSGLAFQEEQKVANFPAFFRDNGEINGWGPAEAPTYRIPDVPAGTLAGTLETGPNTGWSSLVTYNQCFKIELNGQVYDYIGNITSKGNKTYWLYRAIAPEKHTNTYDNGGPMTKLLRINPTNGKWQLYQYSGYAGVAVQSFCVNYPGVTSIYIDGPALPYTLERYIRGDVNTNWYMGTFDGANGVPVAFPLKYNGTQYFITHIVSVDAATGNVSVGGFNLTTGEPLVDPLVVAGNGTPNITVEECWTLTDDEYNNQPDVFTD